VVFATSAAAAAEFTTTTTTTSRTLFAGAGNVDGKGAAIQLKAVHGGDGLLGFFLGAHGHKTKAARAVGDAINHEIGFGDGAVSGKGVVQGVFCGVEGKISYKQFIIHVMYYLLDAWLARLFPLIGFQIITEALFT